MEFCDPRCFVWGHNNPYSFGRYSSAGVLIHPLHRYGVTGYNGLCNKNIMALRELQYAIIPSSKQKIWSHINMVTVGFWLLLQREMYYFNYVGCL